MHLLSVLFPETCYACGAEGTLWCSSCAQKLQAQPTMSRCGFCHQRAQHSSLCSTHHNAMPFISFQRIFAYTPLLRKTIQQLKYYNQPQLAELLIASIMPHLQPLPKQFLICPLPSPAKRTAKRSYSHTELLAHFLSKATGQPTYTLLQNKNNRPTQVGLSKVQRRKNLQGAISLDYPRNICLDSIPILLIDDIITTGSTFLEAAHTIIHRHPQQQLYGLALAQNK